jgi:hypothetical protein
MGPDRVELECLLDRISICSPQISSCQLTWDSSSPVMHPLTSVLLAKTSKLAPESRCGVTG